MRRPFPQDHELFVLWPLSIPLVFLPLGLSAISKLLLGWSLAALLFSLWRLARSCARQREENHTILPEPLLAVRSLSCAVVGIQLLPVVWIGAVWALQAATRLSLLFQSTRRVLLWVHSLHFADPLFWLLLFMLVCLLAGISRRLLLWHRKAIEAASGALLEWWLVSLGLAALPLHEVHNHAD